MQDPAFTLTNPNRARALIGVFAGSNPVGFHAKNGSGYAFLAEQILALDKLNPQTAARMMAPLGRWKRMDPSRQTLMKAALKTILSDSALSPDVFEIADKSLKA
jgi:aminopeptidase N